MKIAFVSIADSSRLTSASQHSYFMAKALRDQGLNLELITPLQTHESTLGWMERKLRRLFGGRRILRDREPSTVRHFARQVEQRLDRVSFDILFSHGTIPIGLLEIEKPIAFWADATFAGMLDFFPSFSRISRRSIHYGNLFEQMAITKSALAVYSSDWARNSCLANYKADPAKVFFVPYGANLEKEPTAAEVEAGIRRRAMRPCKLLYIGQDWRRKGGALAVRLAEELNRRGLPAELTLIGSFPDHRTRLPVYVRPLGTISKSDHGEIGLLTERMRETHFLVLPTHADSSPRVLNEANAFGIPCLTTCVGGIASIVQDEVNGHLFPPDATFPERAAEYIAAVMASPSGYQDFARRAYSAYITKNNWNASAKRVKELLEQL